MRPFTARGRGALAAVVAAALLCGCVYRLDTQQGNILDPAQVDQVQVGMTRSQVRFLLGTPMIADPFDQSRWDYIYWQRAGRSGKVSKSQVTVWFDGDQVARLERRDAQAPAAAGPAAPSAQSGGAAGDAAGDSPASG